MGKVVLIVESRVRIGTMGGPIADSGIRGGKGKKVGKRGCTGVETKLAKVNKNKFTA
jgi:hypothetical protein